MLGHYLCNQTLVVYHCFDCRGLKASLSPSHLPAMSPPSPIPSLLLWSRAWKCGAWRILIGCETPPCCTEPAVQAWTRSLDNLPNLQAVQQHVARGHPGQQLYDSRMSRKMKERQVWNLVDQFMIDHQADVATACRVTDSRSAPEFYGRFLDPIVTPLGEILFGNEAFEGHVLASRLYTVTKEILRCAWERQAARLTKAGPNLTTAMSLMQECLEGETFLASHTGRRC
jgi:hypothetical protein